MKRLLTAVLFLMFASLSASAAPDLVFTPREGGKYIYSNNREFIYREDLADVSNMNAKFIMSNEAMGPDKYTLFASHVNHTETKGEDGIINSKGFDIELDVMFRAKDDTRLVITALGFEVPENVKYYINGEETSFENDWGCFNAWASYLGMEISELDSGKKYTPVNFEPVEVYVKAGETAYLSSYIPNYRAVPIWRPVHIITDFEITEGLCDINVFACRTMGYTAGNRKNLSRNIAFGAFVPQYEMKGVANSRNHVDAYVNLTIPGNVSAGSKLPVRVYNRYSPDGKDVPVWYTNLNPTSDIWNKDNVAESSMLSFEYKDPSKKKYYGKSVAEEDRSDVWYFDTNHVLLWEYKKDIGYKSSNFVPNFEINEYVPEEYCNSLGNYGVFQNYHVTVTNEGYSDRWLNYTLNTGASNLIILRDENGNVMEGYPLTKGTVGVKENDRLVNIKVPARETVKFTLTVILTTNYPGGMENAFVVNDMSQPVKTYSSPLVKNVRDSMYTGKEYLRYDEGKLYTSSDKEIWTEHTISREVQEIFKTSSEIKATWTGDGYILNNCQHSGIPYYSVREFYRDVWFLDENFALKGEDEFEIYPTASSGAFDVYYIKAGSNYYSDDGDNWELLGGNFNLPCYNYGKYAATMKNGSVWLTENGVDFSEVLYGNFKPLYIDSLGDVYYFISGTSIYVSYDGVYWQEIKSPCEIYKIGRRDGNILVNDSVELDLPQPDKDNYVLKFEDKYFGFDNPPIVIEDTPYIPLREFAEMSGAETKWNDETSAATVIRNGCEVLFVAGECVGDTEKPNMIIDGKMMFPADAVNMFKFETEENK